MPLATADVTAVLEELRLGEPPLGPLGLHELSWLDAALTHLQLIYRRRRDGSPRECAFCIFSFGSAPGYVQFLAHFDAERLYCEAASTKSVPDIATVLTSKRDDLLRSFGFAGPGASTNYSQRIDVRGTADLAYAARLAFHVMKQVYGITDFGHGAFKLNLPSKEPRWQVARPTAGETSAFIGATAFKKAAAKHPVDRDATVEAEKPVGREVILGVGAEGGSLALYGRRDPDGWRYFATMVDQTRMLLDEDKSDEGEIRKETGVVDSWDAALRLMDRYTWHRLHPLTVHPEFRERVWAAVQSRFDSDQEPHQVRRWRELCAEAQD